MTTTTSWLKALNDDFVTALEGLLSNVVVIGEWVIEVQRDKLTQREIHVAPAHRKVAAASRGLKKKVAMIQCMIVDPLRGYEEVESAQLLVDQLEGLLNTRLGIFTITEIHQPIVLDTDQFRTERKISTTVVFTFEGIE